MVSLNINYDYVPVISTLKGAQNIYAKLFVIPNHDGIKPLSKNIKKIDETSMFRCVTILIPVFGNIAVALFDLAVGSTTPKEESPPLSKKKLEPVKKKTSKPVEVKTPKAVEVKKPKPAVKLKPALVKEKVKEAPKRVRFQSDFDNLMKDIKAEKSGASFLKKVDSSKLTIAQYEELILAILEQDQLVAIDSKLDLSKLTEKAYRDLILRAFSKDSKKFLSSMKTQISVEKLGVEGYSALVKAIVQSDSEQVWSLGSLKFLSGDVSFDMLKTMIFKDVRKGLLQVTSFPNLTLGKGRDLLDYANNLDPSVQANTPQLFADVDAHLVKMAESKKGWSFPLNYVFG